MIGIQGAPSIFRSSPEPAYKLVEELNDLVDEAAEAQGTQPAEPETSPIRGVRARRGI